MPIDQKILDEINSSLSSPPSITGPPATPGVNPDNLGRSLKLVRTKGGYPLVEAEDTEAPAERGARFDIEVFECHNAVELSRASEKRDGAHRLVERRAEIGEPRGRGSHPVEVDGQVDDADDDEERDAPDDGKPGQPGAPEVAPARRSRAGAMPCGGKPSPTAA